MKHPFYITLKALKELREITPKENKWYDFIMDDKNFVFTDLTEDGQSKEEVYLKEQFKHISKALREMERIMNENEKDISHFFAYNMWAYLGNLDDILDDIEETRGWSRK